MSDKQADLAGPGIGDYDQLKHVLPDGYAPLLGRRDLMRAVVAGKRYIADHLCQALNLEMVEVPLVVTPESGVNDMLDRDGSRTPVRFRIANDGKHPLDAEIVQAATKWKRVALKQFGMGPGEGLCTDMRAVRKDYFLDHDHSAYVDQWDWERAITAADRTLDTLKDAVRRIWSVIVGARRHLCEQFPALAGGGFPELPDELHFIHAEEVLEMFPDLPRKQRETQLVQRYPAVFIIGIGWPLADGYPHELRAADYDDWATDTSATTGKHTHGLNGDILVWNPVTKRRHELSSMGVRVDADSLKQQLELSGQIDLLHLPYHRGITSGDLPLSIGGGIGQSRTMMFLLRTAHLGEVSVAPWPPILKEISAAKNIHVLE